MILSISVLANLFLCLILEDTESAKIKRGTLALLWPAGEHHSEPVLVRRWVCRRGDTPRRPGVCDNLCVGNGGVVGECEEFVEVVLIAGTVMVTMTGMVKIARVRFISSQTAWPMPIV